MMPRLLLLGGAGQLGTAIRAAYGGPIEAPSHAEFDICDSDVDLLVTSVRPETVVNCAAFHNVDRCEREPDAAFRSNAVAVDRLAAACERHGIAFVTVSTDYVFAGTADRPYREADATIPSTAYGVSKLAGELLSRRGGRRTIVVRTSGVFGTTGTSSKGYTLIDRVLAQAEAGTLTRMVGDMTFSPSYAPHVARAICDLIERRAYGVHHVVNAGACTWYDFVRTAFEKAGFGDAPLERITYASLANPTPRPMFSPMDNTTFAGLGIAPLPAWPEALDAYLDQRRSRVAGAGFGSTA